MLLPIIKKYWKLLLGTMIISVLGCAVIIGLSSACTSVDRSIHTYLREYRYPDACLTTELTERDKLEDLQALPGVSGANARLSADTVLLDDGRYLSVRVFSYDESDIQQFHFWSSADGEGADEAYLDYNFAAANGISAGDSVKFRIGDEWYDVFISGIVSMPETIAVQPTQDGWDINADFGYAYVPVLLVSKAADRVYEKSREKLDEKQQELAEAEAELSQGKAELDAARAALANALTELTGTGAGGDSLPDTETVRAEFERARSEIAAGRAQLAASQSELDERAAALAEAQAQLAPSIAQIDSARAELSEGYARMSAAEAEIAEMQSELDSASARLEAMRSDAATDPDSLAALEAEVAQKQDTVYDAQLQAVYGRLLLQEQQEALDEQAAPVDSARAELDSARYQIDAAQAEIDAGYARISSTEAELNQKQTEYETAEKELQKKQTEYEENRQALAEAQTALEDAYMKLEDSHFENKCNQFLLWFEDSADPEAMLEQVDAALGDVSCLSQYTFADSAVREHIEAMLHPISTMSVFITEVFFSILLIIVFLFMSFIIRQCRREIGILRALGFTVGSIQRLFCAINLIVSLLAVVLGVALGRWAAVYVGSQYRDYFPLPVFEHLINVRLLLISIVATIVVGQLATLIGATYIGKIPPAEAMSRTMPSAVKVPAFLGKLTRQASPITAFSITSLLRNRVRFIFSAVCLAASVMMIFASLAFFTSRSYILDQTYEDRIHYGCQIFFSRPVSDDMLAELRELDYLRDVQPLPAYYADISFNGRTERAVVNVPERDTDLIGITDRAGAQLPLPEQGIILEQHIAEALGVSAGDRVSVNGCTLPVEAISFQCVNRIQYAAPASADGLGPEDVGTVILNIDEADESRLLSYLADKDGYIYTVFTRLSYEGSLQLLHAYDITAWVIIIFAVIAGFVIVLNTTRTNLWENKKELCILRTIGFQQAELSRSWFSQSILQFIGACIFGFPAGRLIAQLALDRITIPGQEYVYASGIKEILITVLLVFIDMIASHAVAMRTMRKWDIVESIKEKE